MATMKQNDTRVPLFERKRPKPFTLALAGLLIGLVFSAIVTEGFIGAHTRGQIASTESQLRNLSIPLEAYFADTGIYPPGQPFSGDFAQVSALVPKYLPEIPRPPSYRRQVMLRLSGLSLIILGIPLSFLFVLWIALFNRSQPAPTASIWNGLILWSTGLLLVMAGPGDSAGLDIFATLLLLPPSILCGFWISQQSTHPSPRRAWLVAGIVPVLLLVRILQVLAVNQIAASHTVALRGSESYMYATDGKTHWLLQDTGPDCVYNFDAKEWSNMSGQDFADFRNNSDGIPPTMIFYDPTNGTVSDGDIFRFGP